MKVHVKTNIFKKLHLYSKIPIYLNNFVAQMVVLIYNLVGRWRTFASETPEQLLRGPKFDPETPEPIDNNHLLNDWSTIIKQEWAKWSTYKCLW